MYVPDGSRPPAGLPRGDRSRASKRGAHVTEIEGAFKLSQDRDRATRERVIAGMEAEPELARGELVGYTRRFAC